MLRRFLRDERGATALEYSLIGMLVSLAIIGGMTLVADDVGNMFNRVTLALE